MKFEDSSDPVLLLDRLGKVIWLNGAFSLLIKKPHDIKDILDSEDASAILNNQGILFREADLNKIFGSPLRFNLLSFKTGSGDPQEDLIFVILKAAKINLENIRSHENNINSVAHDLKNPLGAIFGYADALIDTELSQGLTEKHKDILSRIRSTAIRSIELVRNLQQLSHLESTLKGESDKATDLNQVALAVYKGTWRDNQHKPEVVLQLNSEPMPVFLERIVIDRIVTNLYSNALKYTPSDGTIIIRTFEEANYVIFEIKNTNALIAKDEIDKIFDNRYRGKSSSGTAGTGLGLYIVKEILKKVSGKISVKSSEEDGTVFTVSFPKRT